MSPWVALALGGAMVYQQSGPKSQLRKRTTWATEQAGVMLDPPRTRTMMDDYMGQTPAQIEAQLRSERTQEAASHPQVIEIARLFQEPDWSRLATAVR